LSKAPLSKGGRGDLNFLLSSVVYLMEFCHMFENDFLATFEGLIPPAPLAKGAFC
jgi:hypothetical protein